MTTLDLPGRDLPRTVFAILCIGTLLTATLWVLRPFLPSIVWSTIIVVATWPLLCRMQGWCGGRRLLAVAGMMLVLLLVFFVPIVLATTVLVSNAGRIGEWLRGLAEGPLPGPPAWLEGLPAVGASLAEAWRNVVSHGPDGLAAMLSPHLNGIGGWFVAQVGSVGVWSFQVFMTLLLACVLYARGEHMGEGVRQFARRLAGERGDAAAVLAATASRAVAYGVVVTALIQAFVGGLGLLVAGIPAWAILSALMFFTSIAQVGAAPVVGAAAIWLFVQGSTGWAIGLGAWALVVGSLDNVVRPVLIGRTAHIPLLVVFVGVIGGLIAFGPVGLFVGPVALVVSLTLLKAWISGEAMVST